MTTHPKLELLHYLHNSVAVNDAVLSMGPDQRILRLWKQPACHASRWTAPGGCTAIDCSVATYFYLSYTWMADSICVPEYLRYCIRHSNPCSVENTMLHISVRKSSSHMHTR